MHRALCRPPAYTHTRLRGKEGPPGLRCGRAGSGWGGKHSEAPSARSARGHEHRAGGGGCAVSGARPLCSPVLFVWAQSGDPPLPPPPTPPARLPPHPELFPTLHSPHPAGLVHSAISAFGHSQRRNRDIQRRGGKRKQPRPQAERLPAMLAELQPPPRSTRPRAPMAVCVGLRALLQGPRSAVCPGGSGAPCGANDVRGCCATPGHGSFLPPISLLLAPSPGSSFEKGFVSPCTSPLQPGKLPIRPPRCCNAPSKRYGSHPAAGRRCWRELFGTCLVLL